MNIFKPAKPSGKPLNRDIKWIYWTKRKPNLKPRYHKPHAGRDGAMGIPWYSW
jgi:hypothetical protein